MLDTFEPSPFQYQFRKIKYEDSYVMNKLNSSQFNGDEFDKTSDVGRCFKLCH